MYSYGLTALSSSTGTGGAFADLCLQKSELANVRVTGVMKIQQIRLLFVRTKLLYVEVVIWLIRCCILYIWKRRLVVNT